MKRKFLTTILTVVMLAICFCGLTACLDDATKGTNENNGNNDLDDGATPGIEYILREDGTYMVNNMGSSKETDVIISSTYKGVPVTKINGSAFMYANQLESITIPDSVIIIGAKAFNNTALYKNESNWEDEVLYIGKFLIEAKNTISGSYNIKQGTSVIADDAFASRSGLTDVNIPDSVKEIGINAFYGCSGLTDLTLPSSVKVIQNKVFMNCSGLINLDLPDGITDIGWQSFYGCSSLTNVTIPDSVTNIEMGAFSYCSKLTSITIPNSVTFIGQKQFEYCSELESIVIPDSITEIVSWTFMNCDALKSLTIPKSVIKIGQGIIENCGELTDIYYEGTKSDWEDIEKNNYWNEQSGEYTIHCSDGTVPKKTYGIN